MQNDVILPVLLSLLGLSIAQASAPLSPLDQFVVSHGFGGAQFVRYENTYRVPINANGQVGDLTVDTGAANSVIFRAALKKFKLTAESTDVAVRGVFGAGKEKLGLTTIRQLTMGNLTLENVKTGVVSDPGSGGLYRPYGLSDGLFGLREMLRYGVVLDLDNHLILAHPGGPVKGIGDGIRSILTKKGYTPIALSVASGHLHVSAVVNGMSCRLVVDTGAFLTVLDQNFARKARIGGYSTGAYARGFGTKARPIRVSRFPELKVGDFTIHNASVTISELDPGLLAGGSEEAAGLLGAEYLGLHGAIFDFNSGTLYLRPKK